MLPILALDQGVVDAAGVRAFSLTAQRGTTQFREGVGTSTLGFNGALLGPALRLRTGESVRIDVQNNLDEETTSHWHGLFVPAEMDGGPHQMIAPGARWSASFKVENRASTCWFHPHVHGNTGRQVVLGMGGLLIVEDPARPNGLPATWGVDDLALVVQDKRFTSAGQIDYTLTATDRQMGYMGDTFVVNGAIEPLWKAPKQWVRLRLLNACNARTLRFRLGNSAAMLQVANEGGLLAAPVSQTSVTLTSAERAEVLVDFGAAAIGDEISLLANPVEDGGASAADVMLMKIRIALPPQADAVTSPPATLPAEPPVVAPAGATVRTFSLDTALSNNAFAINGALYEMGRIDFTAPATAVEIWEFSNITGMSHPMHVHGVKMTMLARDGKAPGAVERGLRDTFMVASMETVRMAVRTAPSASDMPLMLHCHLLEHEDSGMMAQFITT